MSGRARVLTPGLRTFLAVDVVLVVTLIALAIIRFADTAPEPPRADATGETAVVEPAPEVSPETAAPPLPDSVLALDRFVLPSGNIWCEMAETSASCTILQFSFAAPEAPPDCAGSLGHVLTVTGEDGAFLPCVTEVAPVPEGTAVLEYGQASAIGQMSCFSSTNGATCRHNATGTGFSVARAGYRIL